MFAGTSSATLHTGRGMQLSKKHLAGTPLLLSEQPTSQHEGMDAQGILLEDALWPRFQLCQRHLSLPLLVSFALFSGVGWLVVFMSVRCHTLV